MPLSKALIPSSKPHTPLPHALTQRTPIARAHQSPPRRRRNNALAGLFFWAAAITAAPVPSTSSAQGPKHADPPPHQNHARETPLSTPPAPSVKRLLRWADFDGWRSITSPTLSPDGSWLAYSFMPARGDGEIIVRQLFAPTPSPASPNPAGEAHTPRPRSYHVNAGEIPPPPFPQGPTATGRPPPTRTVHHLFTGDSRFLLSLTFPSARAQHEARLQPAHLAADPRRGQVTNPRKTKQSLTLVDLAAGRSELVPDVQSVQVSLRGSWVAYLHEPLDPSFFPNSAAQMSRPQTARQNRVLTAPPLPENRRLVLRELLAGTKRGWGAAARQVGGTGQQKTFEYVSEYSLTRDARTLLYLVDSPTPSRNGLYAYTPGSNASPHALLRTAKTDAERLSSLTWDLQQTQVTFLIKRKGGHYDVGLWKRGERMATTALSANALGLPPLSPDLQIGEHTTLQFSSDGKKLIIGLVARSATEAIASASRSTDTVAEVHVDPLELAHPEVWRWDDDRLPPRRNVLAEVERPRTYAGILDLETGRYLQLGNPHTLQEVRFSEDGLRALGFDETPYLRLRDYDATYADVYAIDTRNGTRRLIAQKLRGASGDEGLPNLYFSPTVEGSDTRYAAYFDNGHWYAADLATGAIQALTAGLPVSFAHEHHDKPEPPPPYGWAGWLADARSLVVYDRYDLWQLFIPKEGPRGKTWRPALNLTGGLGRAQRLILRVEDTVLQLSSGETTGPALPPLWVRGLDPSQPLTLRGEDERTRDSGFFRQAWPSDPVARGTDRVAAYPQLERLLWGARNTRFIGTARSDLLLFTASRFDEFPDLWVSNADFSAPKRVSDGNAQLAPFAWGSPPEVIDYRNSAGAPLNGLLYTPPNFDPSKRYPLIVYLYERLSPARHGFFAPSFGANLNIPYYTSNGYLVYLPDIAYEIGTPGPSALDSVNAALDAVLARGFVDPVRIGIQGSSWGGYQVAHIVMHSDRFRAAVAGSPVSNMTSAYADIRWRSGRARLFQYEQSQSRIGAPLTEAPELYVANSPLFAAHKLRTPLLLMHNDGDGVVPWGQSTQLFLTLRRHEKPVWFINYPYETHEIARYANRRDFQQRAWAFFEHHLRGGPKPDWMHAGSTP